MNTNLINTLLGCMIIGIVLSIPFIQGIIPIPIPTLEVIILIAIIFFIAAPLLMTDLFSKLLCFKFVVIFTGCIGAINIWQSDYTHLILNVIFIVIATYNYTRKQPE